MSHYYESYIVVYLKKPRIHILSKRRMQKKTMNSMHLYDYDIVNTTSILKWIVVPIMENKEKQKQPH